MTTKHFKLELVAFVLFAVTCIVHTESNGGMVYSSSSISSDRAEKHRTSETAEADHLPITAGTIQKELTISQPLVYTTDEKPGEKWLNERPQLTTQTPATQPTTATPTMSGIGSG